METFSIYGNVNGQEDELLAEVRVNPKLNTDAAWARSRLCKAIEQRGVVVTSIQKQVLATIEMFC